MLLVTPVHAETTNALLVEQINQFSLDIFNKIETDNNMVLSPYSLAAGMVYLMKGSAGDTRDQLLQIFHIESASDMERMIPLLNSINHELITNNVCQGWLKCKFYAVLKSLSITDYSHGYIFNNSLWIDKSINVLPAFENTIPASVSVRKMDFSDPVTSMQAINQWVANRTSNLVIDIVPEETLNTDSKMVLINAIYFKGLWELPFNSKDTADQAFTLENNLSIQTSFMKQKTPIAYAETDTFQAIELPYANSSFNMIILLPKKSQNVHKIVDELTVSAFTQLLDQFQPRQVSLSLPKFGITSSFLQLDETLGDMGAADAFNPDKANFSLITPAAVSISQIVQKAVIEVNENGVEVTATSSLPLSKMQAATFNANHPFIFFIIDKKSRIILLTGQLMNP